MENKKVIPMVAVSRITSSEGVEEVRALDAAWTRLMEVPIPASCKFIGYVRKDNDP